ncbi:MAG: metallophosphoesterase family protein [Labilithrix sp.]|nr:metallophosphoesterase family protein [Labilithrix sp.]MCW5832143.1 metallophosphoesterase family protein [Labilithrix sp.]
MPVVVSVAAAVAVGSALAVQHVRAGRRAGLTITHHRIPWPGRRTIRVAQLTDVHVGLTTPRRALARVAETVHGLRCDVVVMTGDYVNASLFHVDRVTELVRSLPQPCVAVLGNHDHWTGPERVTRALEAGGARVLRNASTELRGDRWSLVVVGVDDGRTKNDDVARAFARVDAPRRALTLTHDPRTAAAIAKTGAPLVLAGHTHAGQIHVPRVLPRIAELAGHPYLHGFHRVEQTDLYVSAGVGHSLPGLRSARTAPEIAVFDLDPSVRRRHSSVLRAPLD